MLNAEIVLCLNCGAKNRVARDKLGTPKCGKCGASVAQPQKSFRRVLSLWSSEPARPFAALFVIGVLLAIGYSLLPNDFFTGTTATSTQRSRTAEITRLHGQDFIVVAFVNGARVRLIVDTGASAITLTPETANAVGVSLKGLSYSVDVQTANGRSRAAPVRLDRVTIGDITERSIPALVSYSSQQLGGNLLGMSFLNRLESWEVRGDKLIMRGRP